MNVKERIESIQNSIDSLQDYINGLDQNLQYYNVLIPDQCQNPMQIRIFRRNRTNEPVLIKTLFVNLLDQYTGANNDLVKDALGAEFDYLTTISAPTQQFDELQKITNFLGI